MTDGHADSPSSPQARTTRQFRHRPLWGTAGTNRISSSTVTVVGAGGLACPALTILAAAEPAVLRIIDDDVVERHNLARQTLYRETDIGKKKAVLAAGVLQPAMPCGRVEAEVEKLTADNAGSLLLGSDVVADTSDNWETRFAVADTCTRLGIPLVWGSVVAFDGMCTVFVPGGTGLDDVVDRNSVLATPGRQGNAEGTFSPLCGQVGSAMAGEVLKLLTGVGTILDGQLQIWDTADSTVRLITLNR